MSIRQLEPVHPVAAFARKVRLRGVEMAEIPTWSMTEKEQRATLVDLARARSELDALYLRVLAEADAAGVGDDVAAASAADWVAVETQQLRRDARADLKLAERLPDLPALSAGMARGEVNLPQARAIVRALDQLPAPSAEAEQHLVELAQQYDAKDLTVLGRHLFEVMSPEEAERLEGQALARQEARALAKTSFTLRHDDQGMCHFRGSAPSQTGERIEALLLDIHDPKTPSTRGSVDWTSSR